MARNKGKSLTDAIRAPFRSRFGLGGGSANTANAPSIAPDWAYDNGFEMRYRNAADTDDIRALLVDSDNDVQIGEEVVKPMYKTVNFNLATAASQGTQVFFIADRSYRIAGIQEIHATAETTATTLTGYVEKLTGTTVPGSGTTVQSGTFNLKATANTYQTGVLSTTNTGDSDNTDLLLASGDRIGIVLSAASTELAGVTLTLTLAPAGKGHSIVYAMKANGDLIDQHFFIANRDYIVTRIDYVHSTLGTNGGAVTLDVKKCTGTQAAASGTTCLSATFNCKSAINTIQNGALTATTATLRLAPGDRLSVDFTGTLTALAGVVVTITLQAVVQRKPVTYTLYKNGNLADQAFFIADRNYEVLAISGNLTTAGTDGGAVSLQVTRDTGTDAPGAGTDLLSNNTNAGFDLKGTPETVQVGTFKDTRFNFLMVGDRLSVDYAGTLTTLAGVTVTVDLAPR